MKRIQLIIIYIFLINTLLTPRVKKNRLPLIINSQKKVFNQIALDIKNQLPKNIDILVYDVDLINSNINIKENINNDFQKALSSKQNTYNYQLKFESDITANNDKINLNKIKNSNEIEMIELGEYLNMDAVMLTSISIVEKKKKMVINKNKKSIQSKQIGLIQGDIISARNNNSLLKFSYYFLLN